MTASVGKYAPTAIVMVAVGYCCWPYLDDPGRRSAAKNESKLPEIASASLSPTIAPAPGRDPFGLKADPKKVAAATAAAKKKAGPSDPKAAKKPATLVDKMGLSMFGFPGGSGQQSPEVDLKNAVKGVALNATFLRGNRRVAIINNELYSEGELLDQTNSSFKAIKVSQISERRIVLERRGQTTELLYPELPSKSVAAPSPPRPTTLESLLPSLTGLGSPSKRSPKGGNKSPLSWIQENIDSYKARAFQNSD